MKPIAHSYTPLQLKTALTKMLPKRFKTCDCVSTKAGSPCNCFYFDGSHVKDSELLHVCNLIEKSLPLGNRDLYIQALYSECEKLHRMAPIWYLVATAEWNTKTIALAKVLGVKIK
jgi:hypothetical protein